MSIDYDRWKLGLDEPWQTEPDEDEEDPDIDFEPDDEPLYDQ